MPTKTKLERTTTPRISWIQFVPNPPSYIVQYPSYEGLNTRTTSGCKDYKTKIRNGQSATTPYSGTWHKTEDLSECDYLMSVRGHTDPSGYIRYKYGAKGFPGGEAQTACYHLSVNDTEANWLAYKRFVAAVKAQQQHMSGFTFLGEFRETVRGLMNPANALVKGLNQYFFHLEKGKRGIRVKTLERKRRALADIAAGLWLEASFGLAPSLNDTKGIAETLARWQVDNRHSVVRGFGSVFNASLSYFDHDANAGNLYVRGSVHRRTERTVIYRGMLKATDSLPPKGSFERLAGLAGFNLQDFIPSVYQLIPGSFLLDYFTGIGDILETSLTSTADVAWCNSSIVSKSTEHVRYNGYFANPSGTAALTKWDVLKDGWITKSRKSFDRTALNVNSLASIPYFSFSLPGTANKYANIAALLVAKSDKFLRF